MSSRQRDQSDGEQPHKEHAGVFPSSAAHSRGNETKGPTPGHEFATDTALAADEKGEHSQLPVEGGAEVEQVRRQERGSQA